MKIRILLLFAILIGLVGSILIFIQRPVEEPGRRVQIELLSTPYPMVIGPMELRVVLSDENGKRIDNAHVQIITQIQNYGSSPPILDTARQNDNGEYYVTILWSIMGQATVTVRAELPDEKEVFEEVFPVFIFMQRLDANGRTSYPSQRQIDLDISRNTDHEYWIFIPQGAAEIHSIGGEDFAPDVIPLSLSGQHTLVIRNDDFADHAIGPFYIRAGETIRQQFTQEGIFEGLCSVNHWELVQIIIRQ